MKSVNELLVLFMRQAQLERAMNERDGARIVDEQEHQTVKSDVVVQDNDRV